MSLLCNIPLCMYRQLYLLSARYSILFITLAISIFQVLYHFTAVALWTTLHLSARSSVIRHVEKNSPDTLFAYQVMATGTCRLSLARWKPPQVATLSTFFLEVIKMFLGKREETSLPKTKKLVKQIS